MSIQDLVLEFPKLSRDGYIVTSNDTSDYNCFAWAAHDTKDWSSPLPVHGYYWPADKLPGNLRLQTFIELYRREGGFVPCDHGGLEEGFEKIALYAHGNGNVTHAARQKPSGVWTSKLGMMEDIEHQKLTSLEDAGVSRDDYGHVIQFLKRPLPQSDE